MLTRQAVDERVRAFLERPDQAAVLTDFDGTLSPIVRHAADARPLPGVVATLGQLARRFGRVAVISGRPAAYLTEHLTGIDGPVILSGLYGLEEARPAGRGGWEVVERPDASPWRGLVTEVADRADRESPAEVSVERKGLALTLHWRAHPDAAAWAQRWAAEAAAAHGLIAHPAKASVELRPPVERDKGHVVDELVGEVELELVCFVGDDVGDLPAFAALRRFSGTSLAVAVDSDEVASEVIDQADLVVPGPEGALAFLRRLL
jgi:trehalose 6-phosphate phosphatase